MAQRFLLCVAGITGLAWAAAGCSADRADEAGGVGRSGDEVTVEGCLTGGPDGRFVLTAAPDPGVTAAARVGMGERDTHSYVLIGGSNLQQHVGQRVAVSGRVSGRGQELEREQSREAEARPTGTSGGGTPTVETKEEIDVEVRQLSVSNVREVAPTCQVTP